MENQNKPDWLIKAEEEQAKFNQSKYGKMTEKELKRFQAASLASSCVSKENRIKSGRIGGNKNVESGHLKNITKLWHGESASNAGKKGGSKNVETGWIKEFQNIGTVAAAQKLLDKKIDEIKQLCFIMEEDVLYSFKQLNDIATYIKGRRLGNLLHSKEAIPFLVKQKNKSNRAFYKKIKQIN